MGSYCLFIVLFVWALQVAGSSQQASSVTCKIGATDVWLAVDVSRHTRGSGLDNLKRSLQTLLEAVKRNRFRYQSIGVGFISYSDVTHFGASPSLSDSEEKAAEAINNLPNGIPAGKSNIHNALWEIERPAREGDYPSYVIVITPVVEDQREALLAIHRVRLKKLGYTVVVLANGVGSYFNLEVYRKLASGPRYFFESQMYPDFETSFLDLIRSALCVPDVETLPCPAGRTFDFSDPRMARDIDGNSVDGITVSNVVMVPHGLVLIDDSSNLHLEMANTTDAEPLTLKFKYREFERLVNPDQASILVKSSSTCEGKYRGTLVVKTTSASMGFYLSKPGFGSAHVDISLEDFHPHEFKEVTLVYDGGYLSASIKGEYQQHFGTSEAPQGAAFPCGLDFGSTDEYSGFKGVIVYMLFHSCPPGRQ